AWTWHGRKPVSIATRDKPAFVSRFIERLLVCNQRVVCCTCCLEPWAIHVKPCERIRRSLRFRKQLLAIETIASVVTIHFQNHAEARHAPLRLHCGERNDVHLL